MILSTNPENLLEEAFVAKVKPKYKSFPKTVTGPSDNNDSIQAVYEVTEHKFKYGKNTITSPTVAQQIKFDEDKKQIKWAFRIDNNLMNKKKEYIIISERSLMLESETDFTQETDRTLFKDAIAEKGYLQATIDPITRSLTITFSKWLDGMKVYVEAYRNNPDSKIKTPLQTYIKETNIKASPEIIDSYWLNSQGKKITATGFETNIQLYIETLGLIDEGISLQLFDYDGAFNPDDSLLWDGQTSYDCIIDNRKFSVPYAVKPADSTDYANGQSWFEGNLEVYVNISFDNASLPITIADRYAEINFTPDKKVNLFLAKKEEVFVNNILYTQYNKIDSVYPGMTAYLVAETANLNGTVTFSITENTSVLVLPGIKLPLLVGTNSQTDFTATIVDDFAIVQVKFQEVSTVGTTDTYNEWLTKLMPVSGNIEESILNIKLIDTNTNVYEVNDACKVLAPIVTQHIYHEGFISKENYIQNIIKKVKFVYHPTSGEHDLGVFDVVWAQKWIRGSKKYHSGWKKIVNGGKTRYYQYDGAIGVNKTALVKILNIPIPSNTRKKFEFFVGGSILVRLSEDTSREYFNPERIAAIIGAIVDCGHDDIITNGSVDIDGTGAYSVSHVNGNNIDFKYLRNDSNRARIDIIGGVIYTNSTLLDQTRQNEFLDSLYKFGIGRLKDSSGRFNLSYYLSDGVTMLNHCDSDSHHKDHLHVQGFKANYKAI